MTQNNASEQKRLTRRKFLQGAATASLAFTIVPRHVLGGPGYKAPSDRLNIGAVGIGGVGRRNVKACAEENIVALCDVDDDYAAPVFEQYPQAKKYRDYRQMLETQKDIDAVIIATPDHSHAVIAMMAMKMGKHVYVQKPLTHSVHEARMLTETARSNNIVTQMGNQGHSGDGIRLICEWIWDGAIGNIREVHAWTNRPVWPQGEEMDRPQEIVPVPSTLDWDLWVGPAALRPYHPIYLPAKWRAWCDFGTGSLGDMACHVMDPIFWALKLQYPENVEACTSTFWHGFFQKTEPKNETYPRCSIVRYRFPARDQMPPVNLTWWDGGLMPPRPEELEPGRKMGGDDGGVLFLGDEGILMCGCYGMNPRLVPEKKMKEYKRPAPGLDRIPEGMDGHEKDWIRAVKGGKPASANFDYSGPLSEMVLMGNLAVRYPNRKLLWDGLNMKVTNDDEANDYVRRKYRNGWSL